MVDTVSYTPRFAWAMVAAPAATGSAVVATNGPVTGGPAQAGPPNGAALAELAAGLERSRERVETLTNSATTVLCLTSVVHTQLADVGARAADVSGAAARVAEQSRATATAAAEIRALVDDARAAVAALAGHARDIEHVSTRLNVLAVEARFVGLNAAIEAARAGDAGRTFAVVADKVRELADGASDAATQIIGRLGRIRDDALQSAAVMERAGVSVGAIDAFTAGVADAAAAQEAGTAEITSSLTQVSGAVDEIVRAVEDITEVGMVLGDGTAENLALAGALGAGAAASDPAPASDS